MWESVELYFPEGIKDGGEGAGCGAKF